MLFIVYEFPYKHHRQTVDDRSCAIEVQCSVVVSTFSYHLVFVHYLYIFPEALFILYAYPVWMIPSHAFTIDLSSHCICYILYVLDADSAPTIVRFGLPSEESSVVVSEGDRLTSVPHVTGDPTPTVTFYKDGAVLTSTTVSRPSYF